MESLWQTGPGVPDSDAVADGATYDDVVVGAGLTGLTTGVLLARAGRRVVVLEAREVGAVTTGRSTAKLSLLQGTKLSSLRAAQSLEVTRAYVDANREGQEWLLRFCAEHDVPVQVRDAVTYAAVREELDHVRHEHEVGRELGLGSVWKDDLDVPFPHVGGTVLADQAQFDPMQVLRALADELREHGGELQQGHRVIGVSWTGPRRVTLDDGRAVRADKVVLATGSPILDRGLYFAKLDPGRSYCLAYDLDVSLSGMYLSAGPSTRSVRDAPVDGGRLLVGGNGHPVGRTASEAAHLDELREWTATWFPDAVETHAWSAQDYASHDGFPYVGALPRGGGHIFVATGYDKWGMANAVAAARNISASILGAPPSWARVLGRRVTRPGPASRILTRNTRVGLAAAGSLVQRARRGVSAPPESCGLVGLCTHLGGVVQWNDAERTWDCPLHGSRFAEDGEVLEGPATRALVRLRRKTGR